METDSCSVKGGVAEAGSGTRVKTYIEYVRHPRRQC